MPLQIVLIYIFSDEWMNKLTEEGFSVKLNYKLKKVFAPSDPDRIHYNFRGMIISNMHEHTYVDLLQYLKF